MSRKKGIEENSGKTYTVGEYNVIFFLIVSGFEMYQIATRFGRPITGIARAWSRLCTNATDYPDKRLYQIKPLTGRTSTNFSGAIKEYIEIQWTKTKVKPSISELSKRLNHPEEKIQSFIEMNETFWKTPKKSELF